MNFLDTIYGNEALKRVLRGFSKNRAFPNSFIISGIRGSGKYSIALICAMAIGCQSDDRPCGSCPSCVKIKDGICPDVITLGLSKDRKTIGIDSVRELCLEAYIAPNDLQSKVYIIKDADKMTIQAQNALLKLFEEGPSNCYFILLAENSSLMLPTVRSRAPELKTQSFDAQTLDELLSESSQKAEQLKREDPIAYKRILSASGGSYGYALELINGKNKKMYQSFERAEEIVSLMCEENSAPLLLALLNESSDREKFYTLLSLIQMGLSDMVQVKKCTDVKLKLFADVNKAKEISQGFTLKTLIDLLSVLSTYSDELVRTNVNVRTAAIHIFNKLTECK